MIMDTSIFLLNELIYLAKENNVEFVMTDKEIKVGKYMYVFAVDITANSLMRANILFKALFERDFLLEKEKNK
jgi:hypothetical protein